MMKKKSYLDENIGTLEMFRLAAVFLFCVCFFVPHAAQAETYFLNIKQKDTGSRSILQTCSHETSPCTFMMPIQFKEGVTKNLFVVARLEDTFHHLYLHFFWNKTPLTVGDARQDYKALAAGESSDVVLYRPVVVGETANKNDESFLALEVMATVETNRDTH